MPDREKVIKGLYDIGEFVAERIGIERARNFIQTIDDACALLKEQEARVYTFTELDHLPIETDIWCEVRGDERIFAQTTFEMWFSPSYQFRDAVWKKKIRYWTARPTKEQIQEVKWDA